jgi:uncharacterized protein DUF1573
MKTWIIRRILVIVLALQTTATARAVIRVFQPEKDLGLVRAGMRLSTTFDFVNDGPLPVEILEVRPGCGCLVASIEPRLLEPGRHGTLTLNANTLGQAAGPHVWTATLRCRLGTETRDLSVRLRATIITEVSVQPATLTIVTGGQLTQDIVLTDQRPQPLSITGLKSSSPCLHARLVEQHRDDQGRWVGRIKLEVLDALPAGKHETIVSIFTSDPAYADLQVRVTLIKESSPPIRAAPERIVFQRSDRLPRFVRVRSAGDRAVEVEKIESTNGSVTCRWAPGPGNQATVRIQPTTANPEDRTDTTVRIHVMSPVRTTIAIPVVFQTD